MNISQILLLNILIFAIITIVIIVYDLYTNKKIIKTELLSNDVVTSNDLPVNDISFDNETDLLIPDRQMIYNQNDINRPGNDISHQQIEEEDLELKVDQNSVLVNTTGDTPLVYSLDELTYTVQTPSESQNLAPSITPMDAGSGIIKIDVLNNNNKLYKLRSIN